MKKKLFDVLLIVAATFVLASCSNPEKTEESKVKESADNKGQDIVSIDTISTEMPEKLKIKSEIKAFNTTSQMVTYYDGDKSRIETTTPNLPKSILIYFPEEGIMYSYIEGETSGVKMTNADTSYAEEMGFMMDAAYMLADMKEDSVEDIITREETLDGEKVIYFEGEHTDKQVGIVNSKLWFSNKYNIPLKYEVVMGENIMSEYKVIEIDDNFKMDEDLFIPSSLIDFQEMDMETMMEHW